MRAFSLALLTLVSSAQVLPGLHHLTTEHAVCPEHGELTHAATAEIALPSGARSVDAELRPAASLEDEHEHCAAPALGSAPALVAGDATISCQTLDELGAGLAGGSPRAESSLPLLAIAPKLAPPV